MAKVTHWTPEELAEMRRQEARDYRPAYEQDAKGHKVAIKKSWVGHLCPEYEHCPLCVDEAWDCAGAVMGGIIGMGEAIRRRSCCPTCGAGPDGPCMACVRCA